MRLPRIGDIIVIQYTTEERDGTPMNYSYSGTVIQPESINMITLQGLGYCNGHPMEHRDSFSFGARRFVEEYDEYNISYCYDSLGQALKYLAAI